MIFLRESFKIWYTQDKKSVITKTKEKDKIDKDLAKLAEQSEGDQEAHVAAQKHYQAVSAGLSSNTDGEDATLNDQLMSK